MAKPPPALARDLPSVAVVEITGITDDGYGRAEFSEKSQRKSSEILVRPIHKPRQSFTIGDRLLVRIKNKAIAEGEIIRKLPRLRRQIFGEVVKTRHGYELHSSDRKARTALKLMRAEKSLPFAKGDLVEAELQDRTAARVIRNLGRADSPAAFAILAIAEFDLRHVFPPEALELARKAKPPSLGGREDLREIPLITIDGADAKDFDDAVFAEPHQDGGYRLIVAIADVAHYVASDGALDREARLRGNSVYLPGMVIPMLPEDLSNGLCSLVPHEDRACLAVEMIIDKKGVKTQHRFFRGLMRSHARLTYDEVENYRLGIDSKNPNHLIDHLLEAYELRAKIRTERGALNLDLPEKRIVFDDKNQATGISKSRQSISQKLIEEFMILANVAAAETLSSAKALCVFRAHESPSPQKIDELHDVLKAMGIPFAKGQVIHAEHFNAMLKQAENRNEADKHLLNEMVLRCQAQADYRIRNPGHFGLALKQYAHFTSPIRRYADLMVHRSLINHLGEERFTLPEETAAAEIASSISTTERIAASAERKTIDRYAVKLLEQDTGTITEGRVTTITSFGAFVEFGKDSTEGLLPLRRLPDDYYDVDTILGVIKGRKSGLRIRLGDTIDVMIVEASPLKASVVLAWTNNPEPNQKRGKIKKRHKRRKHR